MSSNLLFAIDYSGSTGDSPYYWSTVQSILEKVDLDILKNPQQTKFLFWDNSAIPATYDQVVSQIQSRRGHGGTNPLSVAEYLIKHDFSGTLCLISDGQCRHEEAYEYMSRHTEHQFAQVDVHLIDTSSGYSSYYGKPNMSVSCAFTRGSPHHVELHAQGARTQVEQSLSREEIAAAEQLLTIGTMREFLTNKDTLEKLVQSRCLGASASQCAVLRGQLLTLKNRLVREQAEQQTGDRDLLTEALDAGDYAAALGAAEKMILENDRDTNSEFDRWFNKLLAFTSGALQRTFTSAQIASEAARYAATAPVVDASEAVTAETVEVPVEPFECPILYDTEETGNVCILVYQGTPILTDLDRPVVDRIKDCPLSLLLQGSGPLNEGLATARTRLLGRLGHGVSLATLKGLENSASVTGVGSGSLIDSCPFTRKELEPVALCLGANASHAKATDSALFRILTGNKKLGNPDLYFAALTRLICMGAIPYLKEHESSFLNHLVWRLKHRTSFASISALPGSAVLIKTKLASACWFVYEGASLAGGLIPGKEPARHFLPHLATFRWILDLLGTPTDPVKTRQNAKWLQLLKGLLSLRHIASQDPRDGKIVLAARALWEPFHVLDSNEIREVKVNKWHQTRFVPVYGATTDIDPLVQKAAQDQLNHWAFGAGTEAEDHLSPEELWSLVQLVDVTKGASEHRIPVTMVQDGCGPLPEWTPVPDPYCDDRPGLDQDSGVTINPGTLRPQTFFPDGTTWHQQAITRFGLDRETPSDQVHKHVFSGHRYMMEFAQDHGRLPKSADEYQLYVYVRHVARGDTGARLPTLVIPWFSSIRMMYVGLFQELGVEECLRRYSASQLIMTGARKNCEVGDVTPSPKAPSLYLQ